MPKYSRSDDNQPEIIKAFERMGATVSVVSQYGVGYDLVLGYRGQTVLVEVKDGSKPLSARKLTPNEERFHNDWKGAIAIIENIDQAVGLLNSMAERASLIQTSMCFDLRS